jgi:hypothetical protein
MASYPQNVGPGLFLPTTPMFDVGDLKDMDNLKELVIRLTQSVNNITLSLNLKDSGYYVLEEFVNGQVYFPNPALSATTQQQPTMRQVFRKVIDFGALPNAAAKVVAHGIAPDATFTFTRIYATASDPIGLTYIPIPYASTVAIANNVQLDVGAVNVTITTGINRTNYTRCFVVLEYIKQ